MVVAVGYYLYVALKYYRWEILSLIGINKVEDDRIVIPEVTNPREVLQQENPDDYLPKPALEIDISPLVQSFADEVQAYIQEAKPHALQPELLYSLQVIAAKYPALKDADCKDELLQIVFKEVNNKYPGLLELSDLKFLWK